MTPSSTLDYHQRAHFFPCEQPYKVAGPNSMLVQSGVQAFSQKWALIFYPTAFICVRGQENSQATPMKRQNGAQQALKMEGSAGN